MPKRTNAQQRLIDRLSIQDPPHRIGIAMREIRRGAASLPTGEITARGLTPGQQFDALGLLVIEHPGGCRMTELARAVRVDASTATRAVDRLVRDGLAVRRTAEDDGRALIVEASRDGVARYLAAVSASSPVLRGTLDAAFTSAEQAILAELLDRLVVAFDEQSATASRER